MASSMIAILEANPVIAAVKDEAQLARALTAPCEVVILLFGDVFNIAENIRRVKESGRTVLVHMDLIHGFSSKEILVDYIHSISRADGIISTRPNMIRRAREIGLFAVLRAFLIDSLSLETIERQLHAVKPDAVELMPAVACGAIRRVAALTDIPIIAGGLLDGKEDIYAALQSGATCTSTTKEALWGI